VNIYDPIIASPSSIGMIFALFLQAVLRATSAEMDGLVQKVGRNVNMPVRIAQYSSYVSGKFMMFFFRCSQPQLTQSLTLGSG